MESAQNTQAWDVEVPWNGIQHWKLGCTGFCGQDCYQVCRCWSWNTSWKKEVSTPGINSARRCCVDILLFQMFKLIKDARQGVLYFLLMSFCCLLLLCITDNGIPSDFRDICPMSSCKFMNQPPRFSIKIDGGTIISAGHLVIFACHNGFVLGFFFISIFENMNLWLSSITSLLSV